MGGFGVLVWVVIIVEVGLWEVVGDVVYDCGVL